MRSPNSASRPAMRSIGLNALFDASVVVPDNLFRIRAKCVPVSCHSSARNKPNHARHRINVESAAQPPMSPFRKDFFINLSQDSRGDHGCNRRQLRKSDHASTRSLDEQRQPAISATGVTLRAVRRPGCRCAHPAYKLAKSRSRLRSYTSVEIRYRPWLPGRRMRFDASMRCQPPRSRRTNRPRLRPWTRTQWR
jgi:hypothetical protein